jgi:hypothetical protein
MATSYSTNLALTLQGTNDNPGTWGDITNTNLGTLLEQAISGYEVQSLTSGTTLTLTIPNGSSGVARNMYLEFTGNGSTVVVPSNKKLYFVYNNCSSGTITMKVAGQTGVTIPNGERMVLVSNGTDVDEAITVSALEGITTATTTALGVNAGDSITSGASNVFVGYDAGTAVTTGANSVMVGYEAGLSTTTGNFTTAVGYGAARSNISGSSMTALGYLAAYNQTGSFNTAVGRSAFQGASGSSGSQNTAVGAFSLNVVTSGSDNTAVGYQAGDSISTASGNTLVGYDAGSAISTNGFNTAVGLEAYLTGNYLNSLAFGFDAQVTGNNYGRIGDTSVDVYAKSFNNTSDARDKADIQDTNLGLSFIMQLQPRMYRWDFRELYRSPKPAADATKEEWDAWREVNKLSNLTHDGTHKRNRFHQGFVAQEVKAVMDSMGVDFGGFRDAEVNGGDAQMGLEYTQFIAPLIKAIQELKAEFDEYKRTHP